MKINIKSKLDSRCLHSKKTLSIVSLLFMLAIISSPFVSVFSGVSPFALGADVENIRTEANLVKAIDDAPDGTPYVIDIGSAIELEETLEIPADKNITLTSSNNRRGLFGADGKATITVMPGGELVLDGIIVSHVDDARGTGVYVSENGKLTMVDGKISDNNVTSNGGGIYNAGNFTMIDGEICNNTASTNGGGVYNVGNFNVTGGEIYYNDAKFGGGICSDSDNFRMTGGKIYSNTATEGGGIYNDNDFFMSAGQIYKNTARNGGGLYNNGNVSLSRDGMIYNNTATYGGGVYTAFDIFEMFGGIISNNTATENGGGIHVASGLFDMTDGLIANNTAKNGGGIGTQSYSTLESIDIGRYAVFSNNRATAGAYSRAERDDEMYHDHIDYRARWSIDGQGYNNYDIQYTRGTPIDTPDPTPTPTPSASTSPTATPPTNTVSPTNTPGSEGTLNRWWPLIIVAAIVIALIVALLVFYLPKNTNRQEPDWIDSTPNSTV